MNPLARLGDHTLESWRGLRHLAAVLWAVLTVALRRRSWPRTVREELVRQVFASGVGACGFVTMVAILLGVSVVAQALVWVRKIGEPDLLAPLLVTVLVREAVPVLTNLLLIARSGSALTTDLGSRMVAGEVRMLDAQGLDPFLYLVMPRVIGLCVAVCCLSLQFLLGALASGYLFAALLSPTSEGVLSFAHSVLISVDALDLINFAAKSLLPALFTGIICCTEGLAVGSAAGQVPAATRRALGRSVRALFLSSALVSLLTYL
ncbi:ABC transporter permease [Desulfuromonas versatilis]|uniref:ABC transporter permease n=1 Tax=Desulfuromonas versatilis TaxID=2802975 RepID=A0ABN6DUQ4_9BACT|nr:ABC transporter permease [Desulfuromonas versatilis]BCR03845.1 ABC transporter permease [Desulfuromonas versatilis]